MKHLFKEIEVPIRNLNKARALYEQKNEDYEAYISVLLQWNDKINLVSRSVSRETIREHVIHSLLPLTFDVLENHDKWIDAGSGGGLPGIPLAIALEEKNWLLNDNVKKKMTAVSQIIHELLLNNVDVIPKSLSLVDLETGTGIVTKHAFKIPDLLRLLGNKPWKTIVMWKGVDGIFNELKKTGKKLNVTLYKFNFGPDEPFYEGKGIVKIER